VNNSSLGAYPFLFSIGKNGGGGAGCCGPWHFFSPGSNCSAISASQSVRARRGPGGDMAHALPIRRQQPLSVGAISHRAGVRD